MQGTEISRFIRRANTNALNDTGYLLKLERRVTSFLGHGSWMNRAGPLHKGVQLQKYPYREKLVERSWNITIRILAPWWMLNEHIIFPWWISKKFSFFFPFFYQSSIHTFHTMGPFHAGIEINIVKIVEDRQRKKLIKKKKCFVISIDHWFFVVK